jgi:hypothetical protein
MGFTEGVALIVFAVIMVYLGRANGPISPYVQVYIVGVIYVMTAMILGVAGVAFIITTWPF